MGRGQRSSNEAVATLAPTTDLRRSAPAASERRLLIGRLVRRARMGSPLSADDQRHLVALVQQATADGDLHGAREGREALVASNGGWVKRFVNQHKGLGIDDDTMLQAAQVGMNRAIDSYDPDEGAGFLHYATHWMRSELSEAAESEAHTIRLKSKAFRTNYRIRKLLHEYADRGVQPTVQQLTDALNAQGGVPLTVEQVSDVLPYAQRPVISLDDGLVDGYGRTFNSLHNAINGDEQTVSRKRDRHAGGAFRYQVADPRSEQEVGLMASHTRQEVLDAVARLPDPVGRRVFELTYGLGGSDEVQQKDMFQGVYRDSAGAAFSGEDAVIKDYAARGETVTKAGQKVLDASLADGTLTFHPDTKIAAELFALGGVPATSGTVQYALARAQRQIRNELDGFGEDVRYRGPDELERSEAAREAARRVLVARGVVTRFEASKLKVSRPGRDGKLTSKGPLRVMAEEHGLVDDRGRLLQGPLEGPVVLPRASVPRAAVKRPDAEGVTRTAAEARTPAPAADESEQPAQAKAKAAPKAAAKAKSAAQPTPKAKTETLHCEAGNHTWTRALVRGAKPKSCAEHRSPTSALSADELAARRPAAKPAKATRVDLDDLMSAPQAPDRAGQTLWCAVGAHEWTRPTATGRPPVSCPEHRKPIAALGRGELDRLEDLRAQARQARAAADEAERAAERAREAAKRAADAVSAAQAAAGVPATKTMWCVAGAHEWEREVGPGRPPMHCPDHRRAANNPAPAAGAR